MAWEMGREWDGRWDGRRGVGGISCKASQMMESPFLLSASSLAFFRRS